ncbi:ubiquitin carboxyl-terminal hydrolase 23-like isoform X2 [Bidens hawaiensis]|uniref:ubiquitin carboxyl-terminal hydrolase 23-like isoform X2 n=1 Tax=Bidens hawaiensis TaxID=980011 RepID=UPI00404AC144
MSEPLSSINNNNSTEDHPIESTDKSPFRRIEFYPARKPFTGFSNGGDESFKLETLNPNGGILTNANHQQSVAGVGSGSGRKRDGSEMENGLDPELGAFGIMTFRRIGAGLENLGNTCFLNSVLQCLTYTEPLAAYLQSGKHQVTCRKSGFCALCAIQNHVSRALQLPGRSLAPKDLVSNLRCISRTFRNSRQEDAHEYMVNLLESMHKCCLPKGVPSESQGAYDKSLVHKIFGGRLRSQVKCMQCNYCSNKFDPFLDLSLEILRADTLHKAFANFTAKEQLDGGAKEYQCQQCKQKVKALKQLTIHKPPNVLTVHLKRFGSHISGQKIDKKIQFGSTLDLKPFVTGPYDGDLKYTLYGVLVHAGWSTHSGHYYCFVRTSSGMWYQLDDNRVYQVSEKKVFEQKAYMLFYFKDRKNSPTKKTVDVHQKEKIVMNGTPNGPGAPREAQMKTGLGNGSLNAERNGSTSAAPKEIPTNTILSNGSSNGHMSSVNGAPKEIATNTILGNGSSNGHTSSVNGAPKEIATNTILSNGSLNGHKSSVNGAPKEAQMKVGLSDGSLNAEMSLASVGIERNGFSPVAPKKTEMDSNLSNGSLNGQKSSAAVASEATQKKQVSVPKSISETSKTEDHTKEIGGGESSVGNVGADGHVEKALKTVLPDLPKTQGYTEKKPRGMKTHKKDKNVLKCKAVTMKVSSKVLMAASLLNQRKKKKHKRNKRVKNHDQENLVNEGPSTSVKTEARETVKPPVENGLKTRVDKDSKESNKLEQHTKSLAQKDLVHMLTIGADDRTIPRWDEDGSAPFRKFRMSTCDLVIGHIGDEWDEEYDRGKRKKVRISKTEFDGKNPFQDIANERLKSHTGKQNKSKRPSLINKKNKHFNKSRSENVPFRIRS